MALEFKDLDAANATPGPNFLNYLNDIHSMILMQCKLYPDQAVDITLDGVNREFALPAGVLKIWSAAYFTTATTFKFLRPSSMDELDYERVNWRQTTPSIPFLFYESGGNVGFYPTPATATANGYPKVTLYTTQAQPLANGNSLPGQVQSPWPWVYGVCWLWAGKRHRELEDLYRAKFRSALDTLKGDTFKRLARGKEYANFDVPRIKH